MYLHLTRWVPTILKCFWTRFWNYSRDPWRGNAGISLISFFLDPCSPFLDNLHNSVKRILKKRSIIPSLFLILLQIWGSMTVALNSILPRLVNKWYQCTRRLKSAVYPGRDTEIWDVSPQNLKVRLVDRLQNLNQQHKLLGLCWISLSSKDQCVKWLFFRIFQVKCLNYIEKPWIITKMGLFLSAFYKIL